MRPAPCAPLGPGIIAHQRHMVVRNQVGDLEGTTDDIRARPKGIAGQLLRGDAGEAVLWQYRRKEVEILGIEPIETKRKAQRIVDVEV